MQYPATTASSPVATTSSVPIPSYIPPPQQSPSGPEYGGQVDGNGHDGYHSVYAAADVQQQQQPGGVGASSTSSSSTSMDAPYVFHEPTSPVHAKQQQAAAIMSPAATTTQSGMTSPHSAYQSGHHDQYPHHHQYQHQPQHQAQQSPPIHEVTHHHQEQHEPYDHQQHSGGHAYEPQAAQHSLQTIDLDAPPPTEEDGSLPPSPEEADVKSEAASPGGSGNRTAGGSGKANGKSDAKKPFLACKFCRGRKVRRPRHRLAPS